jgi:hypothetical protein
MGRRKQPPLVLSADDKVAIHVHAAVSCEDWSVPAGRYECDPERAAMLISRGYAKAIEVE